MFLSKEIDEKLILAFELYNKKLCESLPSDEELKDIKFSEAFEKKMQKLIRVQKKSYFYLINTAAKRVALIVLAIIITLTTTAFSVKAIREAVIEFFIETFTTHSDVSVEGDDIFVNIEFEKVTPKYLPEGFSQSRDISNGEITFIEYSNTQNEIINYSQYRNAGEALSVNTEDTRFKTIYVNGFEGICYEKNGFNKIIFGDEKYFYDIEGQISMDELQKIAESIPLN